MKILFALGWISLGKGWSGSWPLVCHGWWREVCQGFGSQSFNCTYLYPRWRVRHRTHLRTQSWVFIRGLVSVCVCLCVCVPAFLTLSVCMNVYIYDCVVWARSRRTCCMWRKKQIIILITSLVSLASDRLNSLKPLLGRMGDGRRASQIYFWKKFTGT